MFFPGLNPVSSGSRTVFSIEGASPVSSLKELSISSKTGTTKSPAKEGTGSPSKKRSRPPPLPFRLPTAEEERLEQEKGVPGTSTGITGGSNAGASNSGASNAGASGTGASASSAGGSGEEQQQMAVGSPVKIGATHVIKRRSLDNKEATMKTILRLMAFGGGISRESAKKLYPEYLAEKERPNDKTLAPADVDKYLRWCRVSGTDLFWSYLHRNSASPLEPWKCFEAVYQAAIITATKFLVMVDKSMKLTSVVKCVDMSFEMFPFLCKNLAGLILAEYKKNIKHSVTEEIFEHFYECGFRAWIHLNEGKPKGEGEENSAMETEEGGSKENCYGCSENPCVCDKVCALFKEANLALHGLGLMEELAGPRLYGVIQKEVKDYVTQCVSEKYYVGHLEPLMTWFQKRHKMWIETIYPWLIDLNEKQMKRISEEFLTMLLEVYGKCIINDMFAIIIEFPESQPILDDLRFCMKQVNLRNELVTVLKTALERRLLNAGVNTDNVLEAYVATVRALKFVDPSGILAQLVTPPVREYLRHRDETVRVILVSLTDESGELAEELIKNPTYVDKKSINLADWKSWRPDPIDVPKDKANLRKSDLIQALVSIYGTKTVFIEEYRALLADRLLKIPKPGSITREIKCLELLKLRFGESDLQKCEVMLKDVSDSQRLNVRFYEEEGAVLANSDVKLTGLVVSAQFWPELKQETVETPKPVEEAMEKYTKAFEMIKGNRTLEWQKHVGSVELEVEHGGTTLSFSVTPPYATVLWHFQDKEQWKVEDLVQITGMTTSGVKSRLAFWISKGIIANMGEGLYALVDSVGENGKAAVANSKFTEDVEHESPMTSTSTQRATELQMFWSYIEGMLTNLDSLPLTRIHSMLKLFATVECGMDELQKFLDEKVGMNQLVYSAGQYQLPK